MLWAQLAYFRGIEGTNLAYMTRYVEVLNPILGAFAKLRKEHIIFVTSVCPHATTHLVQEIFSLKFHI
jgi:hypothetical protein